MSLLQPNTARNRVFRLGVGLTGVTVTISKNGAAFASPVGALSQIGSTEWYNLALDIADTDTEGDLAYLFAASSGTPNQPNFADEVAAPVKLADKVAHGGTPGSSTATLALDHLHLIANSGNIPAFKITSFGAASGMLVSAGTFGNGIQVNGGTGSGNAMLLNAEANGSGLTCYGAGNFAGAEFDGDQGIESPGLLLNGGSLSPAIRLTGGGISGSGIDIITTDGSGVNVGANGTGKHDINLIGSGDIHGNLTGRILGDSTVPFVDNGVQVDKTGYTLTSGERSAIGTLINTTLSTQHGSGTWGGTATGQPDPNLLALASATLTESMLHNGPVSVDVTQTGVSLSTIIVSVDERENKLKIDLS